MEHKQRGRCAQKSVETLMGFEQGLSHGNTYGGKWSRQGEGLEVQ